MVVGSTSTLDTVAFTDFLNKIQADAAQEFNCVLPTPDDFFFEPFEAENERYL